MYIVFVNCSRRYILILTLSFSMVSSSSLENDDTNDSESSNAGAVGLRNKRGREGMLILLRCRRMEARSMHEAQTRYIEPRGACYQNRDF